MIEHLKTQLQVLRVKLDTDLFLLYDKNKLLNENAHILSISSDSYALTDEVKSKIADIDGNFGLTEESTIQLAEKFLHQKFKNELDNITERGLFSAYLWVALTEFFIEKNDNEQMLNCLCIANRIYGSTLAVKSEHFSAELGKILASTEGARKARIKAQIIAKEKEPKLRELEKLWEKGEWAKKGRGKYSKFASYIVHGEMVEGIEFDAIRTYISKYDKSHK
jgi:hypothetical protein